MRVFCVPIEAPHLPPALRFCAASNPLPACGERRYCKRRGCFECWSLEFVWVLEFGNWDLPSHLGLSFAAESLGADSGSRRNIGLWPVCPADILSAVSQRFSGVQLRWAHRLKVYVPAFAAERSVNVSSKSQVPIPSQFQSAKSQKSGPLPLPITVARVRCGRAHRRYADRFVE